MVPSFTPKFYNQIKDICTTFFMWMLFLPQSLKAHISLIPIPNKDHSLCSNYGPISLIGVDLKIYSKILANRIQHLLSKLAHLDKVVLVLCLVARDNLNKTILLMQHEQVNHVPMCLLSVDAEKAFDRVSWPSLIHTILQIRLDPKMISSILALYFALSTGVRVNGSISSRFFINNGTLQECPLSPLSLYPNDGTPGSRVQKQHCWFPSYKIILVCR